MPDEIEKNDNELILTNAGTTMLDCVHTEIDLLSSVKDRYSNLNNRKAHPKDTALQTLVAQSNMIEDDNKSCTNYDVRMVYITWTENKYHRVFVPENKATETVDESKARGIEPCSSCDPPYW